MSFEQVEATRKLLYQQTMQYWLEHSLWSWQWWFLIIGVFVPWIIWWKMVHKDSLLQISFFGALIAIIAVSLDSVGTNLLLWGYPRHIFSFLVLPMVPVDLCILPVEHMLIYQYFPKWRGFFWMLVAAGLLNAFVAEPLFFWAGIYKLYSWRFMYSIPIYITKGLVVKYVVQRLVNVQSRAASIH